jgi:hypothetical protein
VAHDLENRRAHRASVGKLKEREDLEDPHVNMGIILKCILKKYEKALTGYKM